MTGTTVKTPAPAERPERLARLRNLKMARSAHAYVRGSTAKFYEWLDASEGRLPAGPSIWICGDCHLGNLGPLADARGGVAIQIRDLDQTVIGNPAHDLVRLGLSLASAARGSDLPGVTTARILEGLVEGYEAALAEDFEGDIVHPPVIEAVLQRAVRRKWKHLAEERLDDTSPTIPLGKHFWSPSAAERRELEALFAEDQVRELITLLKGRRKRDRLEILDAAYWVKGCSSLGNLRYAALVGLVGKKEGLRDVCLIDIKEAAKAAAPRDPKAEMPRDNAERIVAGARALSPNLGERMSAARLMGKPVVVRELMPQDLKIEIDQLSADEATAVARALARVVGDAHGRQMDAAARKRWLADLARARSRTLDAPSWLWSSVVELIALHEAAYLEHCRRYALAEAA
jgi:uncharacterized protein (DUF2252 family)